MGDSPLVSGSWNGRKRLERRKEKRTDPKEGTNENQRTSAQQVAGGGSSELRLELKECCDKSLTTVPPFLDSSFGQHCQAKVNPNDDDRPPQPSCNSSFFLFFSFKFK